MKYKILLTHHPYETKNDFQTFLWQMAHHFLQSPSIPSRLFMENFRTRFKHRAFMRIFGNGFKV